MKLVSYTILGRESFGAIEDDSIVDLGNRVAGVQSLLEALQRQQLAALQEYVRSAKADVPLASVHLLPPVPNPPKIICVGLNYTAHAIEVHAEIPEYPALFIRLANTLVPHNGSLIRPKVSEQMDFEGELALVIGKGGRYINNTEALSHVAGYACFNDGSIRDFQFKHSLAAGKNFPATAGFGPWLVTSDEIPDPSQLLLETRLNDDVVQSSTTSDLIFDVPSLISYISTFTPLEPGDVIATGTPKGVGFGRQPPLWMKPGDTVEVTITRIGALRNSIRAERDH